MKWRKEIFLAITETIGNWSRRSNISSVLAFTCEATFKIPDQTSPTKRNTENSEGK